jgi:putative endonuclease
LTFANRLSRRELGTLGEQLSANFLIQQGFRITERNWRCRSGEIDLIAENGEALVFVEVRARTKTHSGSFGTAQESVDVRKQRKVRDLAQVYLHMKQKIDPLPIRFDVICATFQPDGALISLDHIPHAF